MLVLVLHTYNAFIRVPRIQNASALPTGLFEYFDIGRVGITIFFLISGFVIGKSIKSSDSRPLRSFGIKRLFRLYPLFWFSMIAGLLLVWTPLNRSIDLSLILANATMLPAFFRENFIIGLYWSLETELIFYILCAVLFYFKLLNNIKVNILLTFGLFGLLLLFVAFPSISPSLPHWKATPYHLSLMLLGMTWRQFRDVDTHQVKAFGLHLAMILSVPVLFLTLYVVLGMTLNLSDSIAYLSGIVIFALGLLFWRNPHKWLVYLGTISYSIYLLHPVVFQFLKYIVQHYHLYYIDHVFFYITLCAVITVVISHFTYQWIEKPMNQIGHRIAQK